jgi:hypothetical protein
MHFVRGHRAISVGPPVPLGQRRRNRLVPWRTLMPDVRSLREEEIAPLQQIVRIARLSAWSWGWETGLPLAASLGCSLGLRVSSGLFLPWPGLRGWTNRPAASSGGTSPDGNKVVA